MKPLLGACHPAPAAAVSAVGLLLGLAVGLDAATLALLTAAVVAGQLSIGWSNDAIDVDRDAEVGRGDKPAASGQVSTRVLWWAAGLSGAASVVLSALLGAGAVHLLLPAAGWAYNLGLKATWWSGAAYGVGFAALPASAWLSLPGSPSPPWWAPVAGALIGLAAHVANVLPDLADDAAAGIRGLPHRLGPRWSLVLMTAALLAAVLVTGFGPEDAEPAVAVAGAVLAVLVAGAAVGLTWRRPGSRAGFGAVLVLAVLVTVQFALAT